MVSASWTISCDVLKDRMAEVPSSIILLIRELPNKTLYLVSLIVMTKKYDGSITVVCTLFLRLN